MVKHLHRPVTCRKLHASVDIEAGLSGTNPFFSPLSTSPEWVTEIEAGPPAGVTTVTEIDHERRVASAGRINGAMRNPAGMIAD